MAKNTDQTEQPPKKRRLGCLLLGLGLLIAWCAIGWALWLSALNSPLPDKFAQDTPFELMPAAEGS